MSQKEHGEVRSTSGTLKGTYHYLDSPSPHLFPFVFISNVTDSLRCFACVRMVSQLPFHYFYQISIKLFTLRTFKMLAPAMRLQ